MNTRTLGRTGLQVSEIGLGAFGNVSAIRYAIERGINNVDTAAGYGDSEATMGEALKGITHSGDGKPLILTTKLGHREGGSAFNPKDKTHIRTCLEESLRLLRREAVDVLMIHEPDRPRQYEWWDDYENCRGPVLEMFDEFKAQGKIRFTGLGGTTAYEIVPLMKSGHFDVILTAFNYSLLWREAEHAVLPTAREMNMGVVIGSPLQQGALSNRYDDRLDTARWLSPSRRDQYKALYAYLDEIGMPLTEVAMRFVISNEQISTVLTGARSIAEVDANISAVDKGPLPAEVLSRLNEIAAMVPFRPFEEPFSLPFGRSYAGPGMAGR
jgi:aryl-alcohol dehydrogenase-like predicted oxidoreductase